MKQQITLTNKQTNSANGIPVGPTNTTSLLEAYSILSSSECRVLKKMGEGKTNLQIAEELFLTKKTVENHITNIGKKLKLKGTGNVRKWLRTLALR